MGRSRARPLDLRLGWDLGVAVGSVAASAVTRRRQRRRVQSGVLLRSGVAGDAVAVLRRRPRRLF